MDTGAQRTIARLSTVLGAVPEAIKPKSLTEYLNKVKRATQPDVADGLGTLAGAAAGGIYFTKHRLLGVIGGASVGRNLPALLLKPQHRGWAVANMGTTGAAIVGSRLLKKWPVVGFVLGWLGGNAVANRLR